MRVICDVFDNEALAARDTRTFMSPSQALAAVVTAMCRVMIGIFAPGRESLRH